MSVVALISATLAATSFVQSPAPTSPAPLASAPREVCVTVSTIWSGSLEETRAIARDPVPASFRGRYTSTGCARMQLSVASLISWHLAFGSEDSTARALKYLADTELQDAPTPERFKSTADQVWRAAKRPSATTASKARLKGYVKYHGKYSFLAGQYLRAAETFRSASLLALADRYLQPASYGIRLMYADRRAALSAAEGGVPVDPELDDLVINEVRDFQMRFAVEQADLSPTSANIANARATIADNFDPAVQDAGRTLMTRGSNFCEADNILSTVKTACDQEVALMRRVAAAWSAFARLNLLTDEKSGADNSPTMESVEVALAAISAEGLSGAQGVFHDDESTRRRAALYVAQANALEREAISDEGSWNDYHLRGSALYDLDLAERITPAALNPNQFRLIAETYLRIFAAAPARWAFSPSLVRQAAFMQGALNGLPRIAEGRMPAAAGRP